MSVEIKQLYHVNVDGCDVLFDPGIEKSFSACKVSVDGGKNWYPANRLFMAMMAFGEKFPEFVSESEKYRKEDQLLGPDAEIEGELDVSDL
jgi:predicted AAA+ superfamily ATPase